MILKACPFCGGEPYLEESSRGFINGESTRVAFVRCKKCNARSKRVNIKDYGATSRSADASKEVMYAWNQRKFSDMLYNITTYGEKKNEYLCNNSRKQTEMQNQSQSEFIGGSAADISGLY